MADLKARIGERASTGNGMRFERGHVSPSDAVGSKSLLSRMGLDLGNAEIETVHESASPSGPHPSTQSDSLIRRLAIPAPSVRDSMSSATRSSSQNDATSEKARTDPSFPQLPATFDSLRSRVAPMINTVPPNHFQVQIVTGATSIHPQEQGPPRNPSPTRISRLRDALVPVIIKNAQSRSTHPQNILSEDPQARVRDILSDKACEAFREKMRSIQQQMLTLNSSEATSHPPFPQTIAGSGGPSGMLSPSKLLAAITRTMSNDRPPLSHVMSPTSQVEPPRAPKAMLRQRSNRESDISLNGALPTTQHSPAGNLTHYQDRFPHPNVAASTTPQASTSNLHGSPNQNEIPIPIDAAFFTAPSGKVETDTDKRRSPSRRRSSFPSRRSMSPVPSHRHSSPVPRRPSFHHRRSPSPRRRAQSPLPRGRSISPRRRSPPLYSPLRPRFSPPRPPPTSMPFKRSRSRSPPPSYRHKLPLVRSPSPPPRLHHHSPSPWSRSAPSRHRRSSPQRVLEYEKRHSRDQITPVSVDPQPAPRRPQSLPKPSIVSVENSHEDVQQPVEDSVTSDIAPPNSSMHIDEQGDVTDLPCSTSSPKRDMDQSILSVPGLWLMQTGHNAARVLDCVFHVSDEIAEKWDVLSPDSSGPTHRPAKLALRLMCLSADVVQSTISSCSVLEDIPFSEMEAEWPEKGTLLMQINPEKPWGKSWLPLEPSHPPLDLARYIHKGTNLLRLIQLDDLTDKVFVLYASVAPEPEPSGPTATICQTLNFADTQSILDIPPFTVEITWE